MRYDLSDDTVNWVNRVVDTVAALVRDDMPLELDRLAGALSQSPWWEGSPRARDIIHPDSLPQYRRVPLTGKRSSGASVLLIGWPAGYATPVHDHEGLWGIELMLDGVLEVEAFSLSVQPKLKLVSRGTKMLGIGDYAAFSDADYAHRCRNLSARQSALSLHIYGGELNAYQVFGESEAGTWDSVEHRVTREPSLT